jgi:predicted CopG family antitoxin
MAKYIGLSLSEEDYKKLLQFKENEKSLAEIVRKVIELGEFARWMKTQKSEEYYRYLADFLKYKDTAQQQAPEVQKGRGGRKKKEVVEEVEKEEKEKEETQKTGEANEKKLKSYAMIFEGMKVFDPNNEMDYEVIKSSLTYFDIEFSKEEAVKIAEILAQRGILKKEEDGKFTWVGKRE